MTQPGWLDVAGFALVIVPLLFLARRAASAQDEFLVASRSVPVMVAEWLPNGVRGAGFGVLFLASLTTLSGVWSAMTAMVAADFGWERARTLPVQRMLTLGFAVVCWLGANLLVDDILDRLILANIPVLALAFALLAGFHWKRATTAGAWASVAVGVAWGVGCFAIVGEDGGYTWPWVMYGIPLIFGTGVVVSLMGAERDRDETRNGESGGI